ncbi:hypothetical protein [Pseudarthrobacter polychromogenes]|uniref:Integral membrane protein n=1 Tax=Pseudarthrobacter polychromogenes TaxID=1676 RepID=A0ABQ1Y033_9MICC|nr:hypothetical protein [Pseudarthrobacter polychromogenes]GGH07969.1 hypothetical protein GCM10011577_35650 [Pseudarthrobacter polychromogenes]
MKEPAELNKHHRAEALKERVYVTFTALAVVLALQSHSEESLTAGQAAVTLAITVIGTLMAVFVADLISHLAVHEKTPTRPELLRMAQVSFGAFAAAVLPLIFIALAGLGWWEITTALQAATAALVLTLVLIGYLAIRRIHMAWWKRLIALVAEFVLGLAVIGLELIAHG